MNHSLWSLLRNGKLRSRHLDYRKLNLIWIKIWVRILNETHIWVHIEWWSKKNKVPIKISSIYLRRVATVLCQCPIHPFIRFFILHYLVLQKVFVSRFNKSLIQRLDNICNMPPLSWLARQAKFVKSIQSSRLFFVNYMQIRYVHREEYFPARHSKICSSS